MFLAIVLELTIRVVGRHGHHYTGQTETRAATREQAHLKFLHTESKYKDTRNLVLGNMAKKIKSLILNFTIFIDFISFFKTNYK